VDGVEGSVLGPAGGQTLTAAEEDLFRRLAASPNLYERIAKSIAPSIFGFEDIKKAIACMLFGGRTCLVGC